MLALVIMSRRCLFPTNAMYKASLLSAIRYLHGPHLSQVKHSNLESRRHGSSVIASETRKVGPSRELSAVWIALDIKYLVVQSECTAGERQVRLECMLTQVLARWLHELEGRHKHLCETCGCDHCRLSIVRRDDGKSCRKPSTKLATSALLWSCTL